MARQSGHFGQHGPMTQLAWVPQQRGIHRISQKIHDAKWPCGDLSSPDWFFHLALVLLSTPLLSTVRSTFPRCFNLPTQQHSPTSPTPSWPHGHLTPLPSPIKLHLHVTEMAPPANHHARRLKTGMPGGFVAANEVFITPRKPAKNLAHRVQTR